MEPTTLAITALTSVANGITVSVADKIGDCLELSVVGAAIQWLDELRDYAPETALRLEDVKEPNGIELAILEEVKQAATHPAVQAAMADTVAAAAASIESFSGAFPDLASLADKIAKVNFNGSFVQDATPNSTPPAQNFVVRLIRRAVSAAKSLLVTQ